VIFTLKVTGKAKYAEDFRADGMLFCKLLLSPHASCQGSEHRHARGALANARRAGTKGLITQRAGTSGTAGGR